MSQAEIKQVDQQTLAVIGDLVLENAPAMKAKGEQLLSSMDSNVIIDLAGVAQSGSAGVSVLLCWMRAAKSNKKELRFRNMPEKMFDIARVSSLDEFLPLLGAD